MTDDDRKAMGKYSTLIGKAENIIADVVLEYHARPIVNTYTVAKAIIARLAAEGIILESVDEKGGDQ